MLIFSSPSWQACVLGGQAITALSASDRQAVGMDMVAVCVLDQKLR